MDPMSQLGWGASQNAVRNGTARMLRDAFAAGDTVHEAALLEMGVDSNDDMDCREGTTETEGEESTGGSQTSGFGEEGYAEGIGRAA